MLCTRGEGRGEVEASPESRIPRSRHVVISSEMCVCLIMRKVKEKNIYCWGDSKSKRERERRGGYIKNHMRVRKGRSFHYARCNLIGPRILGSQKKAHVLGHTKRRERWTVEMIPYKTYLKFVLSFKIFIPTEFCHTIINFTAI